MWPLSCAWLPLVGWGPFCHLSSLPSRNPRNVKDLFPSVLDGAGASGSAERAVMGSSSLVVELDRRGALVAGSMSTWEVCDSSVTLWALVSAAGGGSVVTRSDAGLGEEMVVEADAFVEL